MVSQVLGKQKLSIRAIYFSLTTITLQFAAHCCKRTGMACGDRIVRTHGDTDHLIPSTESIGQRFWVSDQAVAYTLMSRSWK